MSLPISAVIDPRVDIKQRHEVVLKGAEVVSYQQFQPNQVSSSSININCDPPSRDIGISRVVNMNAVYNVSIAIAGSTAGGGTPLPDGSFGVRSMPYSSTVSSQQISINNDIYAVAPLNQWVHALAHYLNDYNERYTVYSTSAFMLDQAQNYADSFASNRHPLVPASSNSYDQTRNDYWAGSGTIISALSGNTGGSSTITFTVTVTEPLLFLSPLSMGKHGYFDNAIFGADKMTYSATFAPLTRLLSIATSNLAPSVSISSVTVTPSNFTLQFCYLKPRADMVIPKEIVYPYYNMVLYSTTYNNPVTSGSSFEITSNNIQLTGTPSKLYIWGSRPDSDFNATDGYKYSNAFLGINSITVTWNTDQFLASATKQDLYNISVKNGNRLTYSQWADKMGSVLLLDVSQDIGLRAGNSVGLNDNVQMNIKVNMTNLNRSLTITNPVLNILVVYEGQFLINNGFSTRTINNLSKSDIYNAQPNPHITFNKMQHMYGGSFFNDIGHFFKSTLPSAVRSVRDKIKPVVTPALNAISGFVPEQYRSRFNTARQLTGLGRKKKQMRGGSGVVSRQDLKNNIDELELSDNEFDEQEFVN
jgi:hypothetical protein